MPDTDDSSYEEFTRLAETRLAQTNLKYIEIALTTLNYFNTLNIKLV